MSGAATRNKTIVIGMVERGGDALVKVVPDMKSKTVRNVVAENIAPGSEVHADMHVSYDQLRKMGFDLKRINKKALGAYVGPNGETVNAVENFWRLLKQGIKGTHIWVSPEYLEAYAKEFEYRFNRRECPETMLSELLSSFEKPDA